MLPKLNILFKSSDMRFAAKQTFSRFAYKAELVLNRLFNRGSLHTLQSSNMCAGNRGAITLFEGGGSPQTYDKHILQSSNMRAGNRGAITPYGGRSREQKLYFIVLL